MGKSTFWVKGGPLRSGTHGAVPVAKAEKWPTCRNCKRNLPEGRFAFCSTACGQLYRHAGFEDKRRRRAVHEFFASLATLVEHVPPEPFAAALDEFMLDHPGKPWAEFREWFWEELRYRIAGRSRV